MRNLLTACMLVVLAFFVSGALADGVPLVQSYAQESALSAPEAAALKGMRDHYRTKSATLISLNPIALDSGLLTITLPDGKTAQFSGVKSASKSKDTTFWRGSAPNGDHANLAINGQTIIGGLRIGDRAFRIRPVVDGSRYQVLLEMLPEPASTDTGDGSLDPKLLPPPLPVVPATPQSQKMHALAVGDPTISILYVFTGTAIANLGGESAAHAEADYATADLQWSFNRSGVHLNAATAGYVYAYNDDWTGTLNHQLTVALSNPLTLFGHDEFAADVVMLVASGTVSGDSLAGISAVIGATTAANAFAAVDVGSFAVSNDDWTTFHEFGHLLGARHSAFGTTNNDTNNSPWNYQHGSFIINHTAGYSDVCYHTIVSPPILPANYGGLCLSSPYDEWALQWSNPSVYWRSFNTGTATANNAQVLNNNGPGVTAFHTVKLAAPLVSSIVSIIVSVALAD